MIIWVCLAIFTTLYLHFLLNRFYNFFRYKGQVTTPRKSSEMLLPIPNIPPFLWITSYVTHCFSLFLQKTQQCFKMLPEAPIRLQVKYMGSLHDSGIWGTFILVAFCSIPLWRGHLKEPQQAVWPHPTSPGKSRREQSCQPSGQQACKPKERGRGTAWCGTGGGGCSAKNKLARVARLRNTTPWNGEEWGVVTLIIIIKNFCEWPNQAGPHGHFARELLSCQALRRGGGEWYSQPHNSQR